MEIFLINIIKFGKKLAILSKRINRELIYNKKYLKAEKKINTKEGFHRICKRVILIDSVYKENENYYPKVFLEKYNFNKDIEIFSNNSYYVNYDFVIIIKNV